MNLVELWEIIQTRHEGNYCNVRKLTQILTKFPQTPDTIYPETIKSEIQTSYQRRKAIKHQSKAHSIEHRTVLT